MKAPIWLGKAAKKKWKELVEENPALSERDSDTLSLLCQSWQTYLSASKEIDERGINVEGPNGMTRVNPACAVMSEAWKQILKVSKLLGLAPDYSGKQPLKVSATQQIVEGG